MVTENNIDTFLDRLILFGYKDVSLNREILIILQR
jgi:hypothetical protein